MKLSQKQKQETQVKQVLNWNLGIDLGSIN